MAETSTLKGARILITAGPTREYIDPIRFISNPSSGKMGVAIAEEALAKGATVTIVYGKGTAKPPDAAKVVDVETTEEMCDAVLKELEETDYDILIAAAASADYAPLKKEAGKIPSKQESLVISLRPTVKIIEESRKVDKDIFLCAFKAESNIPKDVLIERAYDRIKQVGLDLIVANDVGKPERGFGVNTNEVYVIDANKEIVHIPLHTKNEIAAGILDIIDGKISQP